MKVCPECKYQFGDEHEFCPRHGKRLTAATLFGSTAPFGPGAATVFFNQNQVQPKEDYERYIGTVLDGRYHLLEIRGEGGMGVVFKARHTVIEKICAVKILRRELARDRAVLQRFVQEAKAASRIGHWSIVDVTDFGTLPDGSAYQVMEFIAGDTLAQVNKKGPMWAARALPVAGQIARALAAAHEKGIVHRDLKPENIFLTEKDGRPDMVKIVDFGIAKFAPMGAMDMPTRITRAGAVFGTPEYMAPEQAAGRSDNDHRVDIYALGVILYEMLVGRVPHKGETIVATLAQQMLDPVLPPKQLNPHADVSERVEQVLMTSLNKDRDHRYQTMADFWNGLEWAAAEIGVVFDAPGGPPTGSGNLAAVATPAGIALGGGQRITGQTAGDETIDVGAEDTRIRRRKSLSYALLGIGLVAVFTVVLALALRPPGKAVAGEADAGAKPPVAVIVPDGATVALAPPDAAVVAVAARADATPILVASTTPDAGRDPRLAVLEPRRPIDRPNIPRNPTIERPVERPTDPDPPSEVMGHGPDMEVVVSTRPHGASLYVHGLAAGSDGTTFRRARGTRLEVRCLFPGNDGWEPSTIYLSFDGQRNQVICEMEAKTRCVKDLQNPFKKCPN